MQSNGSGYRDTDPESRSDHTSPYASRTDVHFRSLPASPEITAQFFTGAIITSITYWFSSDRSIPQKELMQQLTGLLIDFRFIQTDSTLTASIPTASDRLP